MKGESWRETGERREEADRIKWRRRTLVWGEWRVREWENSSISGRGKRMKMGEGGEEERRGTAASLSPVTHTDVRGGQERAGGGERKEQGSREGQRYHL